MKQGPAASPRANHQTSISLPQSIVDALVLVKSTHAKRLGVKLQWPDFFRMVIRKMGGKIQEVSQ